jgi:hypothetical protein
MRRVRVSWPLAGVAAVCLAIGFGDLAVGGTTLAAIGLVAAYCVAIPAAVLVEGRRRG